MAIKNIKCPSCGGELQLDDKLEKGFCVYCGNAIVIQEDVTKVKVEHSGKVEISGSVEIDETQKIKNYIKLADEAFEVGNFPESYLYYSKCLECDVSNKYAVFKKGLTAAYMSYTRINELAHAIVKVSADYEKEWQNYIHKGTLAFIKNCYRINCKPPKDNIYPDYYTLNEVFNVLKCLIELCKTCISVIPENMVISDPAFENYKKEYVLNGIELCEKANREFKYQDGYEQVKDDDKYVMKPVYKNTRYTYYAESVNDIKTFNALYRELPSIKKKIDGYKADLEQLRQEKARYNDELQRYFYANPEIEKAYKKKYATPFVISSIGCGIAYLVFFFLGTEGGIDAMVPLFFAAFLATQVSIILAIVQGVKGRRTRERIMNELPLPIAKLKKSCETKEKELKETERILSGKNPTR